MPSFTFQQYSRLLLDHLRGTLPPEVSVGVFGTQGSVPGEYSSGHLPPQNHICWDFEIEARRGGQNYKIDYSIDSRSYKWGQRAQVDIAADAGHLARLLSLGLGLADPDPENAVERLYWTRFKTSRPDVRPDCRYYCGYGSLKCAVNPKANCGDCQDFEAR